MPAARSNPAAGTINGIIYVAGGYNSGETSTLQAYNPVANTWTTLASMPGARYEGNGTGVINGQLYVAGGWTTTLTASNLPNDNLFVYDPASNTWTSLPPMPSLSGGSATGVINNKLYVTTADNGYSGYYSFLYAYDPTSKSWSTLASSPSAHTEPGYGVINGKFYVAGGIDATGKVSAELDVYDPSSGTWSTEAPIPTAVVNATSVVANSLLYVIGGSNGSTNYNIVQIYDPVANAWTLGPSLPSIQSGAAAAYSNGSIFLLGGASGSTPLATTLSLALSSTVSGPTPTPTVGPSPTPTPTAKSSGTARLINISTRAQVGTGGNILIPGFVIGGTGTETLLIRADGPSLTQFGVSSVLAQPSLNVFDDTGKVVAANTGWGTNANPAEVASVAASVGAFALKSGSADCALVVSLPAGAYTVQVSGVNNTIGVALAEIYEVSAVGTRLVNISTRAQVGTGANLIIPGFVISGSGMEELLARSDGPSLAQFGVTGVLEQPSLSVFGNSGNVVASDTSWESNSNASQIANVSSSVGAFALQAGSADSALVITVPAGAYTMQVSGANGTTGVALAELYEVP